MNAWVWILGGALVLSLLILIGPEVVTYVRARRRRRQAPQTRPTPRPPTGPRHSADNAGPDSLSGTAILRWMEQQR